MRVVGVERFVSRLWVQYPDKYAGRWRVVCEKTKLVLVHSQAVDSQQLAYLGDVLG